MKKIFSTAFFILLLIAAAHSQIAKGTWMAGGAGALDCFALTDKHESSDDYYKAKITSIDVNASIGYFVADKMALGLRPSFSYLKHKTIRGFDYSSKDTKYAIGPYGRYYLLNTENPFNIVTDISYQFGWIRPNKYKSSIRRFSAMAGPVIFFNSSAGLEVLLGYSYGKENLKDIYNDTRKGFLVSAGFQIHFGKK